MAGERAQSSAFEGLDRPPSRTMTPNCRSLPAKAGNLVHSALGDFGIEVVPIRIIFLNQLNLPISRPFFEPFFASDRIFRIVILLEIN
jgi:hypothetical protein